MPFEPPRSTTRWLVGDESVHLFADKTRQVPAIDPQDRDLLVSCGAALHHLRVALAALGWGCTVHRLPNPATPDHLASVEFQPHEPSDHDIAAAALISRRRTDRRRMSSWPVPPDHLRFIAHRARGQGALAVAVTDPPRGSSWQADTSPARTIHPRVRNHPATAV